MVSGPPVDGGVAGLLRDVWRHDHVPERGDEAGPVVTLVRPDRQAPGRARELRIERLLPLKKVLGGPAQLSWCLPKAAYKISCAHLHHIKSLRNWIVMKRIRCEAKNRAICKS